MDGSATFTIVMSSTIISIPVHSTTRAIQRERSFIGLPLRCALIIWTWAGAENHRPDGGRIRSANLVSLVTSGRERKCQLGMAFMPNGHHAAGPPWARLGSWTGYLLVRKIGQPISVRHREVSGVSRWPTR